MEEQTVGMDAAETLHREPTYCHEDISVACKKMVSEIAEDLSLTDVRKLQYYFSLSKDLHETTTPLPTLALEVLESLEKKGKFSCYDIEPLEELLKSIQRCDLITKFIVNYKQRYSTGKPLHHSTSSPPQTFPQRKPQNQQSMPSLPPTMHTSGQYPANGTSQFYMSIPKQPTSIAQTASLPASQQPLYETTSLPPWNYPEANASRVSSELVLNSSSVSALHENSGYPDFKSASYKSTGSQPRRKPSATHASSQQLQDHLDSERVSLHSNYIVGEMDPDIAPSNSGLTMAPIAPSSLSNFQPYQAAVLQEGQASALSSQPRLLQVSQETQPGADATDTSVLELSGDWEVLNESTCSEGACIAQSSKSWKVKRKKMYSIICQHEESKSIKLGKMTMSLNCKPCPKLLLRIYPCGEGEDRNNDQVTLGVEIHVPTKHRGQFDQLRVKLSTRVVECLDQSERVLNTSEATSDINRQRFNVYGLVSHLAIIHSRTSKLRVYATAKVECFPSENVNSEQT